MRYNIGDEDVELFGESERNVFTEAPRSANYRFPTPKQAEVFRTPEECHNGAPSWGSNSVQPNARPNQQEEQNESFPQCTESPILFPDTPEHEMIRQPNTLWGFVEDTLNVSPIRSTTDSATCASQPLEPNSIEQRNESSAFKTASEDMLESIMDRMKAEMKAAASEAVTQAPARRVLPYSVMEVILASNER